MAQNEGPREVQYQLQGNEQVIHELMDRLGLTPEDRSAVGQTVEQAVGVISAGRSLEEIGGFQSKIAPDNPRAVWHVPVSGRPLQVLLCYLADYPVAWVHMITRRTL